ncbi:MAG TPA: saccharopine dehydrogenase C-terminal domain-containing protein [bacterium]|nr:saccharopine dehydrogenase C-terminal domain-containing protein [bacterium]HMZ03955.1 saccharopine dehydrogenase C-terminal domain-containing protein [bacterium]HNB09451.1 saccharopine dehydrogenase C-terminal domain-containing protein [bacterium]HND76361.1 saccharopine dehydrogenase C-terminal domain-containing protein [bacterium]HNE83749.1 saccharopine dehydrogenase C-terminal domain-containing protein [bacterium]
MKILVLGAGWMGRAVVFDLLRNHHMERIIVADANAQALKETEAFVKAENDLRFLAKKINVEDEEALKKLMSQVDTVVSAVTYKYNYKLARLAVQCGCNFCDLGGNNTIVAQELSLHDKAKKKNITIIPDCGLAPGMVSVLVADGIGQMDETTDVQIRVGGLPLEPRPPMNYKLVFSVHGLINEYVEPCVKIQSGEVVTVDPMVDVEELEFPAPFGKLEAFNTSGGTSTLPQTYLGKVKNLDYKTIRYPGHAAQFKLLMDLGLTESKPVKVGNDTVVPRDLLAQNLTKVLTMEGRDAVLVRVTVKGIKGGNPKEIQYQIVDYGDASNNITAMMRLTSYPISVIAQMMTEGKITEKGAVPQELAVPTRSFIEALRARNIDIQITES